MRLIAFTLLSLSLLMAGAPDAPAQESSDLVTRLNRLERDLNFVQKQVYSGSGTSSAGTAISPMGSGQMQVQISKLDQEIRSLRGAIEQTQFQQRQTATELKKLSDDVDYRLRTLEEAQASITAALTAPVIAPPETPAPAAQEPKEPAHFDPHATPDSAAKPLAEGEFANSNAHYSHAFKLLNDKKYSEAATSFDAFVKQYPEDPLVSNAYYWLGESYYARADYTRATESFRKGFEASPSGQKAPDNLFKLSKSLTQIKRVNEACIVLAQIIKKYPNAAPRTVKLAEEERDALQCK